MSIHSLETVSNWDGDKARIGLLDPITASDSLALAWAKASVMCELGASPGAIQGEIARVMAPYAVGAGNVSRYEFEDADHISLQVMARSLSGRQARQLAQDVGLAAATVAGSGSGPSDHANVREGLGESRAQWTSNLIGGIGSFGGGSWTDPLSPLAGRTSTSVEARSNALFACERLSFQRHA